MRALQAFQRELADTFGTAVPSINVRNGTDLVLAFGDPTFVSMAPTERSQYALRVAQFSVRRLPWAEKLNVVRVAYIQVDSTADRVIRVPYQTVSVYTGISIKDST
jgi:hypothetical protein